MAMEPKKKGIPAEVVPFGWEEQPEDIRALYPMAKDWIDNNEERSNDFALENAIKIQQADSEDEIFADTGGNDPRDVLGVPLSIEEIGWGWSTVKANENNPNPIPVYAIVYTRILATSTEMVFTVGARTVLSQVFRLQQLVDAGKLTLPSKPLKWKAVETSSGFTTLRLVKAA
jgi:hypothetical protein